MNAETNQMVGKRGAWRKAERAYLAPEVIVSPKALKLIGSSPESGTIGLNVVDVEKHSAGGLLIIGTAFRAEDRRRRGGQRWRLPGGREAEMATERSDGHGRATKFAVGAVAGNVGRGNGGEREQVSRDVWLILPHINYGMAYAVVTKPTDKRASAADGTPTAVDDDDARFHKGHGPAVEHMKRRPLATGDERHVVRDNVGLPKSLVIGRETIGPLSLGTRRVYTQHPHAQSLTERGHERAHMTDTNDGHCLAPKGDAVVKPQRGQSRGHILLNRERVASGSVFPIDAVVAAIDRVDVIIANGGREDGADAGAVEQRGVAARARAGQDGVGVGHIGMGDGLALFIDHSG